MGNIFEVIDKTGRKIYLTKERWTHITSQQSPHAYMTNHLEDLKQTIMNPDKMIMSDEDESKFRYYKFYKEKGKYLRTFIKYLNGKGYVITAYFVRNIVK